jgi:hypothetical protein
MREPELISLLDQCDIEHKPSMAGLIPIVFRDADGDRIIGTIKLSNGGEVLQMRVPLLKAPDASYRSVLLQALLHMTFRYKLLKFGFDPSDGGITIDIDIPLAGDAKFLESQMNRCMRLLKKVTATSARRIIKIKTTGEDPGEDSSEKGAVEALAALAALRGAGEGGEGDGASRLARALAAMAALKAAEEGGDSDRAARLARAMAAMAALKGSDDDEDDDEGGVDRPAELGRPEPEESLGTGAATTQDSASETRADTDDADRVLDDIWEEMKDNKG